MKRFSVLLPLMMLTSCQWLVTHPAEDAEAVQVIEEIGKDLYEYESKTLSPAPPPAQPMQPIPNPPMKLGEIY